MPIYEYDCRKCDHRFEELVMSRNERVACPECGSRKLKKAMSAFAFSSDGAARSSGGGCGNCSGNCSGGGCCGGSCSCH